MKKEISNKYKPVPFWSWNDELDENQLKEQIEWMSQSGIGGFFMHARGGLTTPYLGEKWFSCVEACLEKAKELNMEAYAYDENGWPSGFVGGELLELEEDRDCFLTYKFGPYDEKSFASYDYSGEKLIRVNCGNDVMNVYCTSSSSTADILNKKTVRKFINLTHEKYKAVDKNGVLKGFFTDEPQYYRWGHAYTHCLEAYFKEKYNMDILDKLGLMFIEKEGYRDFRYKYWKAMQALMIDSFAKQIYDWCSDNNYILTGHYCEETCLNMQMEMCAGIMPLYMYEHIPGMDHLGRDISNDFAPRQLCSVAAQFGKKHVLTESFGCVGWDATPEELKHLFEFQAVNGVNLLCHHLLPYSEYGQRKRDYPEHYSRVNPWVIDDFKFFNDEMARIGEMIANSKEEVKVGVLHPIRSCYFNFKREKSNESVEELNTAIQNVVNQLGALHVPYHFLDETIMAEHAKVEGKTLRVGLCTYDVVIIPKVYTMDESTNKLLKEFVNNGGKILLLYEKPTYLEGNPYFYDYLESNISLEEIVKMSDFVSSENNDIRLTHRINDKGEKFFYIVNRGDETTFELNGCTLNFGKWESRIIKDNELVSDVEKNKNYLTLGETFKVTKPVLNFMTIDRLSYSKDGVNFSDTLDYMGIQDILLNERFSGDLYLKYNFDVEKVPDICSALIENQNITSVFVNGNEISKKGSVLEENLFEYDVAKSIKIGQNEVVVKINYYQTDDVYYALFGENITESLLNKLVYSTTIEAIYLRGNFGVEGDFSKGTHPECYVANKFKLVEQKKEISSLILDGFPFFRGKIELEQKFESNGENTVLLVPGRFASLKVFVNDNEVGKMMFNHELDISKFVKKGVNVLRLELVVSNRNLLGPFHAGESEEPNGVGPWIFERSGSWKNGKTEAYRINYSFVKTII